MVVYFQRHTMIREMDRFSIFIVYVFCLHKSIFQLILVARFSFFKDFGANGNRTLDVHLLDRFGLQVYVQPSYVEEVQPPAATDEGHPADPVVAYRVGVSTHNQIYAHFGQELLVSLQQTMPQVCELLSMFVVAAHRSLLVRILPQLVAPQILLPHALIVVRADTHQSHVYHHYDDIHIFERQGLHLPAYLALPLRLHCLWLVRVLSPLRVSEVNSRY